MSTYLSDLSPYYVRDGQIKVDLKTCSYAPANPDSESNWMELSGASYIGKGNGYSSAVSGTTRFMIFNKPYDVNNNSNPATAAGTCFMSWTVRQIAGTFTSNNGVTCWLDLAQLPAGKYCLMHWRSQTYDDKIALYLKCATTTATAIMTRSLSYTQDNTTTWTLRDGQEYTGVGVLPTTATRYSLFFELS